MITSQLQDAQQLIREKRYSEARTLLRMIDHPTATKWLAKLDEIAPEMSRIRPLEYATRSDTTRISARKPSRTRHLLIALMVIVILVLLGVVLALLGTHAPELRTTTSQLDPTAVLNQRREVIITCMRTAEVTEQECQELADTALAQYPAQIDYCYNQYSSDDDIFGQCIQERVWDDMEQVVNYHRALFTGCAFKYRTDPSITSFDYTYSQEVEQACSEWGWSTELMANRDYRSSVDECWKTHDPFNFYLSGRDGGSIDQSLVWMQDFAECVSNTTLTMPVISPG